MSNVIEFCSYSQTASFFSLVAQKLFFCLEMLRNLYPSIDYDESFQLWNWGNYISRIKTLGMLLHLLKLMEELY